MFSLLMVNSAIILIIGLEGIDDNQSCDQAHYNFQHFIYIVGVNLYCQISFRRQIIRSVVISVSISACFVVLVRGESEEKGQAFQYIFLLYIFFPLCFKLFLNDSDQQLSNQGILEAPEPESKRGFQEIEIQQFLQKDSLGGQSDGNNNQKQNREVPNILSNHQSTSIQHNQQNSNPQLNQKQHSFWTPDLNSTKEDEGFKIFENIFSQLRDINAPILVIEPFKNQINFINRILKEQLIKVLRITEDEAMNGKFLNDIQFNLQPHIRKIMEEKRITNILPENQDGKKATFNPLSIGSINLDMLQMNQANSVNVEANPVPQSLKHIEDQINLTRPLLFFINCLPILENQGILQQSGGVLHLEGFFEFYQNEAIANGFRPTSNQNIHEKGIVHQLEIKADLIMANGPRDFIVISINVNDLKIVNYSKNQQMVDSLFHELMTPLNQTLLFMRAAMFRQDINQIVKEQLIYPTLSSLQLFQYFNYDLLDFFSIEAAIPLQVDYKWFSCQDIVHTVKQLFDHAFKLQKIELICHFYSDIEDYQIKADYKRVLQVLINLISNSLQCTYTGNVTVICTLSQGQLNNIMNFQVKDTGVGMSDSKIDLIKAKLKNVINYNQINVHIAPDAGFGITISELILKKISPQNHNTLQFSTNQDRGVTSGTVVRFQVLDMCKIVEESSGFRQSKSINSHKPDDIIDSHYVNNLNKEARDRMEQSNPTKDDSFSGAFELLQVTKVTSLYSNKEELKNNKDAVHNHYNYETLLQEMKEKQSLFERINELKEVCDRFKVLYIDDQPYNLIALELLVQEYHIHLLKADCFEAGLQILEEYRENTKPCLQNDCNCGDIQLIIMDVTMPRVNGIQATKRIREQMQAGNLPNIPVVAYTGIDTEETKLECLEAGMDDFMSKPVNIKVLEEILIKYIFYQVLQPNEDLIQK